METFVSYVVGLPEPLKAAIAILVLPAQQISPTLGACIDRMPLPSCSPTIPRPGV